ncbi:MAG: hypothetical protein ACON35_02230 [Candidatus Marinamargulisbacteria bacterium]
MNINNNQFNYRPRQVTPYASPYGIGVNVQGNNTTVDAQLGLGSSGITGGTLSGSSNGNSASITFDQKGKPTGASFGTSNDNCTVSVSVNNNGSGGIGISCKR